MRILSISFSLEKCCSGGRKGPIWQNVVSIILFLEKASVTTVTVIIIFKTLNYGKLFTKRKYTVHSQFADVNIAVTVCMVRPLMMAVLLLCPSVAHPASASPLSYTPD